jgi:hypothetical protein
MQKSAASANQAGVSYEQLVTMLTIITSKTQLGGNQAGTALQTLMYRLYRVNEGEDFYDENGNRIAATKTSRALSELGVDVYDENGEPRNPFEIMVDVARNWESASNISQEMVLNQLGAGRQRSNIATLIQGLAEDNGELMEKYMSLASGSEGITDEKYLNYLDSLNAALINVQSSFNQLIAAFEVNDTATSLLNFIAEFIQGLAAAEEASGALSKAAVALVAILGTLAVVSAAVRIGMGAVRIGMGDWSAMTGVVAGLGAIGTIASIGIAGAQGNLQKRSQASYANVNTYVSDASRDREYYKQLINDSETILSKEIISDIE